MVTDAMLALLVAHDASLEGRDPGPVLALAPTWANPARLLASGPNRVTLTARGPIRWQPAPDMGWWRS